MRARSGSRIKEVYTLQIAARKAEAGLFNQERDLSVVVLKLGAAARGSWTSGEASLATTANTPLAGEGTTSRKRVRGSRVRERVTGDDGPASRETIKSVEIFSD